MNDFIKLNVLYDFYSDFLTERQRGIFEQHYLNDLSLGEIAENYGITRQGVYDVIKRSQIILNDYEQKLGLVKKHLTLEQKVNAIVKSLKELDSGVQEKYKDKLNNIIYNVTSLLKEDGE